jgi:three-Cys-motif partner protein
VAAEPQLNDDGLITPEIGAWGEHKYRLAQGYARVFVTAMKRKWDQRIYVDLFAGSGRAKIIEGTSRIILGSPLRAIEIPDPFTRYIFCEKDKKKMEALRARVSRDYKEVNVRFVAGDANASVVEILGHFPAPSRSNKTLAFCFADPYSLENLKFETIRQLSSRYIDFLILIPTDMDANRNKSRYCQPDNRTLTNFVGTKAWRPAWKDAEMCGEPFWGLVLKFYAEQMQKLGYLDQAAEQAELVRSFEKNLPLYRLAFFSRNPLGTKFWDEVRKYANPQTSFEF